MSLATRCPACITVFRVSTQDATARGGTVRCGVCGTVFNALDALVNAGDIEATPPAAEPALIARPAEEDTQAEQTASTGMTDFTASEALPPMEIAAASVEDDLEITIDQTKVEPHVKPMSSEEVGSIEEQPEQAHADSALNDASNEVTEALAGDTETGKTDSDITIDASPSESASESTSEAVYDGAFRETQPALAKLEATETIAESTIEPGTDAASSLSSTESKEHDPLLAVPRFNSFNQGFDPDTTGQGKRRAWITALVLAALALAGQGVYVWRNAIAAAWPASKPALQQACALLACRLDLPMALEQLSIESSELQAVPDTKESYTFNALLRSRSPVALRYPAIELTLTDALNQVVARRVLLPEQYLDASQRRLIAQGLQPNAELPLKIAFDVAGTPVIGYRIGLLYP